MFPLLSALDDSQAAELAAIGVFESDRQQVTLQDLTLIYKCLLWALCRMETPEKCKGLGNVLSCPSVEEGGSNTVAGTNRTTGSHNNGHA